MSKLAAHAVTLSAPVAPVSRRYYIMGAHSLPEGTGFTVADSQQHLLTDFAMGHLSVKQVVDALALNALTAPVVAALR